MTFRTRLILWYSGLLAILILGFSISIYSVMDRTLINAVDRSLSDTAKLVTNGSRVRLVGSFGPPTERVFSLPPLDLFRASGVEIQVWSVDNGEPQLEAASINIRDYEHPLNPETLGTGEFIYTNETINGRPMRVLTSPMFLNGKLVANVQAVAVLDTVYDARDRMLSIFSVGGLIAVLVSILIGMWLTRRALTPIISITDAAASIAKTDDLNTRLTWNGPADELGQLVSVFNAMMARLQDLFSVQQRFVADVSHELRTPLTTIRGNLDLIKRYGMDDISLEAIGSETDRMARMVNDLLLLARADYGGLKLELEPLDLDTLIVEAHRQAILLGQDRQLSITISQLEPLRINGNTDRLRQVLLNLLANAIKFTPDGGKITLALHQQTHYALIEVTDTGIGIQPDDLKHIFDRFFQADESRNRENSNSAGLGLAIVKWVVEAHDGKIKVESQPDTGTRFQVLLPLLEDDGPISQNTDSLNAIGRIRQRSTGWLPHMNRRS